MDKLNHYRQLVCNCLTQYTQIKPTLGDIEVFKFFDLERNHYQIFHAGWDGYQRVFGAFIHIDLIGDKIWMLNWGKSLRKKLWYISIGTAKYNRR